MGFYNCADGVWVCGFDTRPSHRRGGNVTYICHSGSGMAGILDCEERIDFNLAVSTGQELSVRMDQYMDFALERAETRVIGLFMETARNPEGMRNALRKARDRGVPVVALKVGRTELSARLAVSHSGAIAGQEAAYQALFDRYGVQRVDDMHEMATALTLFAQPHPVAAGGLVTLHDSGGERQLLIDLADELGTNLAQLAPATVERLAERLDPGLPPVNPLDAWGAGGPGADGIMQDCLAAMMSDAGASMGAVVHDRGPLGEVYPHYFEYMKAGFGASGKPVFLVSNHPGSGADAAAVEQTRKGFPVLDGIRPFLVGVNCLHRFRDFCARPREDLPALAQQAERHWRPILASGRTLDEFESSRMLGDFGIPVNQPIPANDPESLRAAGRELGFPVALKTAATGILHKSDLGGVVLDLQNEAELRQAWDGMRDTLGPEVLVSAMVPAGGREMLLGLVHDAQFGPLVMVGMGGVGVELMRDVACALPPFGPGTAQRLVDSLQHRPLLDAHRGRPAADLRAFCAAASTFSVMAHALGDVLAEIDINPVIVHERGCIAVDALVVGRSPEAV
jgi:acyl-CoA synthetase (NDP forming)